MGDSMRRTFLFSFLGLAAMGCTPSLGACDLAAATEVVYERGGAAPAYAGQAYMINACASCHGQDPGTNRRGAPVGLEFDVTLISATDASEAMRQALELRDAQDSVSAYRGIVYEQILNGEMPPKNFDPVSSGYVYVDSAGVETELPDINSAEGHEIVRNWLACGAPLIQSTTDRSVSCMANSDCVITGICVSGTCQPLGDTVAERIVMPMDSVSFADDVYPILQTRCQSCHNAANASGQFNLGMTAASAYEAIVNGGPAATASCGGMASTYVVASDSDNSLFYDLVANATPQCSMRMPLGQTLGDAQLSTIRNWIDEGALDN